MKAEQRKQKITHHSEAIKRSCREHRKLYRAECFMSSHDSTVGGACAQLFI